MADATTMGPHAIAALGKAFYFWSGRWRKTYPPPSMDWPPPLARAKRCAPQIEPPKSKSLTNPYQLPLVSKKFGQRDLKSCREFLQRSQRGICRANLDGAH
jgi:hypothetical protein